MSVASIQRNPAAVPQTGQAARLAIRRREWTGPTSGLAPGYVQGNLAILPAALAADFMRFCQLNPKPCPVLAAGSPGDPRQIRRFSTKADAPAASASSRTSGSSIAVSMTMPISGSAAFS